MIRKIIIILIILLSVLLVLFYKELTSSYTFYSAPPNSRYEGSMTYVGIAKHHFPLCIVNPIKMRSVKKDIIYHLENEYDEITPFSMEVVHEFFGPQKEFYKFSNFYIIAVNTNARHFANEGEPSEEGFLLVSKNFQKMCVVYRNKETKQILGFWL